MQAKILASLNVSTNMRVLKWVAMLHFCVDNLLSLLLLFHGAQAVDQTSSESSVLGFPFQLFQCYPALLDVCLEITASGVLELASLSWFLGAPSKGMPGDAGIGFPVHVADPSPSTSLDVLFHRLLAHFLPDIIAAYGVWPVDSQDLPQAVVDEC